jgi:hypothetical protein
VDHPLDTTPGKHKTYGFFKFHIQGTTFKRHLLAPDLDFFGKILEP